MEKNRSERGQALILLAVSLVVLLGFTALAIDGSLLYSDRRQLQTAADAAALAGAGAAGNYLLRIISNQGIGFVVEVLPLLGPLL
jgi:uncharacterized membrane protein